MKTITVSISKAQINTILQSSVDYSNLERGFWEIDQSVDLIRSDLEKVDEHLLTEVYVNKILDFLVNRGLQKIPRRLMVFVDTELISYLEEQTEIMYPTDDRSNLYDDRKSLEDFLEKIDWENLKSNGSTDVSFAVDLDLYTCNTLQKGEVLVMEFSLS